MFHLSHAVNTQRHVKSLKTPMKNIFYSPQSIYSVIHCINNVICLTKLDLFCYFFLMIFFFNKLHRTGLVLHQIHLAREYVENIKSNENI